MNGETCNKCQSIYFGYHACGADAPVIDVPSIMRNAGFSEGYTAGLAAAAQLVQDKGYKLADVANIADAIRALDSK